MVIPLTKTLDPEDYHLLGPELYVVDRFFSKESEQHPHRRWEYAMALRAARLWGEEHPGRIALDVGGAGSPLVHMLDHEGFLPLVIDPKENANLEDTLDWSKCYANFVTCISTLEHVRDFFPFLEALGKVVEPGGVLFLTMDIWGQEAPDSAHFHWMRERIFTPKTWTMTAQQLLVKGFSFLGEQDWEYHGDQVYDYSFASLALVKE
ncbi:hypothetical protein LCGC14_1901940 [marine sediment metagenome]|uniref:Methyltransferase type 11 domain-containing protein n=1 Tax=marine sediment metagenome TaxID=412755 RepID=A0A0F9IA67_9ZZZZ